MNGKRTLLLCLCVLLAACSGAQVVRGEDGRLRVVLEGNRIVINQKIEFEHDSAELLASSHPILDEVVGLLDEHDEIYRVQVQGHSSQVGDEQHNMELSTARAASVAEYLRSHGVTAEVTSQGYGQAYPLCQEDTDECHARNRRVEFFVDSR